ncbi:cytochrome d ubiquinol oxidase subunit II [Bordetella avium]|uniref:cytochrome d ubiquinol oxidase subunit II n=1 Tax=Bordetella avium TaxID=521 RepID=UPI000E6A873E|nr:cytochrome d ubiquinol oxidase subunit II [Bordetella avium]RIQ37499.1 cytochrome d ubiquinol oxidase subunit II [Bordetella avium]RIQ38997.1 cytochrome d ubiquinol oxidase subunit II [Bordetella avium]RIQ40341.1 cytochrome d ubiquinol oxidase subunit II [Bordetella avium]RIQ46371.1 cytochrome d ubiquinol oxidase subunit II [Bordetella avium]RIQ69224.1 cytochrome d ubiquinol oxidase subunit II [Bordetella avium]
MIATLAASLGLSPDDPLFWMPMVFMGLMLLLIAAGIVLDGFDIGVGILLQVAPAEERGRMMSLLSPWRDANEFWPLLGIGLFGSAFPFAWGAIMGKLYGPLTLMVLGIVLRSVSFEFRIRASTEVKPRWIFGFWAGSLLAAIGQGMVLGRIATDYQSDAGYGWFSLFVGLCAVAAYALLGACWLAMRVDGELQRRAASWARHGIRWTVAGMVAIAVTLGLANAGIFYKWSNAAHLGAAAGVWVAMLLGFVAAEMLLARLPGKADRLAWLPFVLCVLLYLLMLAGLAYSFFPYLILDDMTIWDGSGALGSSRLVLAGVVIGGPVVLVFNILAYRSVFGKDRRPAALPPP